jgi:hypothetical protein
MVSMDESLLTTKEVSQGLPPINKAPPIQAASKIEELEAPNLLEMTRTKQNDERLRRDVSVNL